MPAIPSRLLSSLAISLGVALWTASPARAVAPEIAAYYDGSTPVSSLPAGKLDYLFYAFGEPDDHDLCAPPTPEQLKLFAGLRQLRAGHPRLHLLISIGGWGQAPQYSDLALTAASRTAFAASCIRQFVTEQAFDGLDLDWEFPVHGGLNKSRPQDRDDATSLVQELRRQLDALGAKDHRHYDLTLAVPAGTWQQGGAYSVSDSYELKAIATSADWLNVMTYDMNNIFSPYSGFNAPLHADPSDPTPEPQRSRDNLDGAVRYFESQGVPADKIMLGVAFYGRGFSGVSPQDAGLYSKYQGGFDETPWKTVRTQFLTDKAWARHWSMSAGAPWLYNPGKRVFFSYDDPQSMGIKASFIVSRGLKGAVIWELGEDDPQASLLDALISGSGPRGTPHP
ncbi:MAG TPA: glycoside hydrolase family 18 protein [Gammaproteobacteria bacterium]|nr:glycoside hydrolase family 18 protein [Gammaproteobacteria bacterium]